MKVCLFTHSYVSGIFEVNFHELASVIELSKSSHLFNPEGRKSNKMKFFRFRLKKDQCWEKH